MRTGLSVKSITALCIFSNIALSGYLYGQTKFESEWFFNENSGSVINDSIMEHHGTIYGPVWETGKFGSALTFDGNNDSAVIPNPGDYTFKNASVMMWIKRHSSGHTKQLFNTVSDSGKTGFRLYINSVNKIKFQVPDDITSWSHTLESLSSISSDQWTHIAATYDGQNMRIYINGSENGSLARSGVICNNSNPLTIGNWRQWANDNAFDGSIDEVKICNYALSSSEVLTEYLKYFVDSSYNLDQNQGTFIQDNSLNGDYSGTASGGTEWQYGISGSAMSFSADGLYRGGIQIPYETCPLEISIGTWIKPLSLRNGHLLNKIGDQGKSGFRLYITDQNIIKFCAPDGNTAWSYTLSSTSPVEADKWSYIVATCNGSNIKIYINGEEKGTLNRNGQIVTNTNDLCIGNYTTWSTNAFAGIIDEVNIYNRALTASEISGIAANNITLRIFGDIKNTINSRTFGSGFGFNDIGVRETLNTTGGFQTLSDFKYGMLRFPHGTIAQHYLWRNPANSFGALTNLITHTEVMTDLISDFQSTDILYQVNTWSYGLWMNEIYDKDPVTEVRTLNYTEMAKAAQEAGDAVNNFNNVNGWNITYWEIGNEDWVYLTGTEYAKLVKAYIDEMSAEDPNLKFIVQGKYYPLLTIHRNLNEEGQWITDMITELNIGGYSDKVHGISMHYYFNGLLDYENTTSTIREDTVNILAQTGTGDFIRKVRQVLKSNNVDWKIFVTEFNISEFDPAKTSAYSVVDDENEWRGCLRVFQNLAHGIMIADIMGKLLEVEAVDYLCIHSIADHPAFCPASYWHYGTYSNPNVSVPGMVFKEFSSNWGDSILLSEAVNNFNYLEGRKFDKVNNQINLISYSQIGVYSAEGSESAIGNPKYISIFLINRNTVDSVNLKMSLPNHIIDTGRQIVVKQLGSNNILLTANNKDQSDTQVQWTDISTGFDISNFSLAKHSLIKINIPVY